MMDKYAEVVVAGVKAAFAGLVLRNMALLSFSHHLQSHRRPLLLLPLSRIDVQLMHTEGSADEFAVCRECVAAHTKGIRQGRQKMEKCQSA